MNVDILLTEWLQTNDKTILKQLIEKLQKSDDKFFNSRFRTWQNKPAIADAEDCMQEFFREKVQKILTNPENATRDNFEAYYCTVRRNFFYDYIKKRSKMQKELSMVSSIHLVTGDDFLENFPDEASDSNLEQVSEFYQQFLNTVPHEKEAKVSHKAFVLRVEGKLSPQKIADLLNQEFGLVGGNALTEKKVRQRVSRLRKKCVAYCKERLDC